MYPSRVNLVLYTSEALGFLMIMSSQELFALTICHYQQFILVMFSLVFRWQLPIFDLEKLFHDEKSNNLITMHGNLLEDEEQKIEIILISCR